MVQPNEALQGAKTSSFLPRPLLLPLCSLSAPPCSPCALSYSLDAPPCSVTAPSLRPLTPSVLPLKRPCSLSRPGRAIQDPKIGVYITYIYLSPRGYLYFISSFLSTRSASQSYTLRNQKLRVRFVFILPFLRIIRCKWGNSPTHSHSITRKQLATI